MAKVRLGWSQLTIPQKIIKASSVSATMGKNPVAYPTPDPPLADINNALIALSDAEAEAIKGGIDRTVARNARLDELTALMNRAQEYVQLTSNGDPDLIVLAGMEVQRAPSPWPVPAKVPDMQAVPGGNAGTVQLSWGAAQYKKSYVVEIWVDEVPAPPGPATGRWQVLTIQGIRRFTAMGLVTGSVYRFRTVAQNSAGTGLYSEEVSSVAR